MPLYMAKLTVTVLFEADDERQAQSLADYAGENEMQLSGIFDKQREVIEVTAKDQVPTDWADALPRFGNREVTCGRYFDGD